jgi:hypothetical protein
MVKHLCVVAVLLTASVPARAEPPIPAVHHAPVVSAQLGEALPIMAVIDHPELVRRAVVVWHGEGGEGEAPFQRSSNPKLPYVASIPAPAVRAGLGYAIEIEPTSGDHVAAFATREDPHPVNVVDGARDTREARDVERLGGRRSVVQASSDYVSFGDDRYFRIDAGYTYRLLGVISEFGIRTGVVRGTARREDVGLNYGAPRIRVRASDGIHIESELLTSVTEVGFSAGGGGAILLGDPYGSKLTLGFEAIEVFGARGYSRLDLVATRWLVVAPLVEVTTMPHADRAGVRLVGEGGFLLGAGFRLDVRGGYQARTFDNGGPSLGAGLGYAF